MGKSKKVYYITLENYL